MKKITFVSILLISSAVMAAAPSVKKEGISAIKALGSTLKSEMKTRMKEDPSGVTAAGFCANSADEITKEVNSKLPNNVSVRRTSLKNRSDANKPDATDVSIIEKFNEAIATKQLDPKSSIEVVEEGDAVRIYKPLLTQKVCLKCHGLDILPEIRTIIKEKYPHDKATGFKEGDLRGVIVAEVKKK